MLLEGGVSKNYTLNWDKDGDIYYTDETGQTVTPFNGLNWLQRQGRKLQAFGDNLYDYINNPTDKQFKEKADLVLAAVTAPFGGGSALTNIGVRALKPLVGKKIAQTMAQGIGAGLVGGSVEGLGSGLINNENPIKTAAVHGALGTLGGGVIGGGLGKIEKQLARNNLLKEWNNAAGNQYFDNYISDLSNKTAQLADYRGIKQGINKGGTGKEYLMIGEKGAANLGDKSIELAKELEANNATPDEIWQQTQSYKGTDGKWRHEILDGKALENVNLDKYNRGFYGKLNKVYNNEDLFKAYPQLARRKVKFHDLPFGTLGYADDFTIGINKLLFERSVDNTIGKANAAKRIAEIENTSEFKEFEKLLNKYNNKEIDYNTFSQLSDPFWESPLGEEYNSLEFDVPDTIKQLGLSDTGKGVLLHELQHEIQEIEDFARGGNLATRNEALAEWDRMRDKKLYDELLDQREKSINETRSELMKKYENLPKTPEKFYNNLGGEVEARNVQNRMNMTPEERALNHPFTTQDVKPEDVINYMGNSNFKFDIDNKLYNYIKDAVNKEGL